MHLIFVLLPFDEIKTALAEWLNPEEEMAQEPAAPTAKKIIESVTKESFFSEIEALKKENEELKEVQILINQIKQKVK